MTGQLTALICVLMRPASVTRDANHEGVVVMKFTKSLYSLVRLLSKVLTCERTCSCC